MLTGLCDESPSSLKKAATLPQRFVMLHTKLSSSNDGHQHSPVTVLRPALVRPGTAPGQVAVLSQSRLELALITFRRCSSFFAEAAVLVLVFGILDFFMLKGRIDLSWILGALAISVGLLAASIAMDFSAQRWIKAHP